MKLKTSQLQLIQSSCDAAKQCKYLYNEETVYREIFFVLFLNRSNKVTGFIKISEGGMTGTVADPRLILTAALLAGASSLVLTHNHPSGSLIPSRQDEQLTEKIKQAARYLDIKVLDHVIISDEGYYSFADEGIL